MTNLVLYVGITGTWLLLGYSAVELESDFLGLEFLTVTTLLVAGFALLITNMNDELK